MQLIKIFRKIILYKAIVFYLIDFCPQSESCNKESSPIPISQEM